MWYNSECFNSCPIRTYLPFKDNKICKYLNCTNYYSYNQTYCIDEIPEGYYQNDSILKTIDKYAPDCKTCDKVRITNNSNYK